MTEDEAKTKWCPMAWRVIHEHERRVTGVLDKPSLPDTRCIGSDCMMWKAHIPHVLDPEPNKFDGHGVCGLAY